MTRRLLFFAVAAGVVALGLVSLEARGGQIPLPSGLDTLVVSGNYAVVDNLKFSNFTYTPAPLGSPPGASAVTVSAFTIIPGETGLTYNASFFAATNTVVGYAIQYVVSTTDGSLINDAYLSLGGFSGFGGTGSVSIGETILDTSGNVVSKVPFEVLAPGNSVDSTLFTSGQSTIIVQKNITVSGGSNGAIFSFTNQGFSTVSVPEPTSMALLGIGLSGLLTFRRFRRRALVA